MVSAACSVLLFISYSASKAQDLTTTGVINQTTGNIVYTDANPPPGGYAAHGASWTGPFVGTNSGGGGLSGGNVPAWNPTTGTFMFGYAQGTVSYRTSVNAALAAAGTGVQLTGYQYSWNYFNQDFSRGTLSTNISLTSNTGAVLQSYNYVMPQTTEGWTNMSGVQNFTTPYALAGLGNLNFSITGKDDRFWAGYYGPQIKDIDVRLRYGVDPCATNPAYSPNCAGFNSVIESANQVPNPSAYAYGGYSVNNSFAINQAFQQAGTGLQIHGFRWGYVANANGPYCAFELIWCFDWRDPWVRTNVNITSNTGASLYNVTREYRNSYNTTNYQYLFPASRPLGSLGNFNITGQTNDQAYVGSMWVRSLYTPDQCMLNPLSSPTCPGYAKALATQTATSNTTPSTTTTSTTIDSPVTTTSTPVTSTASVTTTTNPIATADVAQSVTPTATTASSSSTTSTPTTTTATAPTTTVTPTATNPQPRVGEVTTTGSQSTSSRSSSGGVSTSQVLNTVRAEQSRISTLETTTAMSAVEQAQQSGTKATNDAQSIATTQQAQSMAGAQAVASSIYQTGQTSSQTNATLQVSSSSGISLLGYQGVGINLMRGPDLYSLSNQLNQSQQSSQNSIPTALALLRRDREESKSFEQNSAFEQQQSLSATNPLANIMLPPVLPPPPPAVSTGPSVNAKVKDNDAAGGMSIASIARQPQGFELYMNGLQDRPFYAPKEIYRGQRVVDNARAQRMLSGASDRLHEEMVNQQYKNLEGK